MRKTLPGALALVIVIALALVGCGATSPLVTIGVDALTADPQAFTGELAVEGVVQYVDASTSTIRIIDVAEYEACGLTPCVSAGVLPLYLPTGGEPAPSGAQYEGQLPALEEVVVVVGEVRSGQGGLYFDVERVQRGSQTLISKR